MKNKFLAVFLVVFFALNGAYVKYQLDLHIRDREQVDIRYIPSPQVATFLSFGFKPAMADIYWIQAINYFGEQLLNKKRNYKYLSGYVSLIFGLDPLFATFYDWAGTAFVYNGMPITKERVIESTTVINSGIRNFNEVYRYNRNMIVKGAFNYAIETERKDLSVPYFELAARTFESERDMLLIASSYAHHMGKSDLTSALKLEYLGQIAFEAQNKEQLDYAFHVVTSARLNNQAMEFVKAIRVKMESDDDVKKLVESRLHQNSLSLGSTPDVLPADPRIENTFRVELSRTWMPPDLLVLFSM